MNEIFKQLITEDDNLTFDIFRILAVLGVVVFFGLAIVNWDKFNAIEFGTGFGAVLLAAGGAVRISQPTGTTAVPPRNKEVEPITEAP